MVFFCQRNCYDKELVTNVVTCKPAKLEKVCDGKKTKVECYEVIFEDTVFFPEGGGQPYDTGYVNGIPVLKVIRSGGNAIHYIETPIEVGSSAIQTVNWARRYDHMQQHSAQHLITAVADSHYGFSTLSWYLGEKTSYIELDTTKLLDEHISKLEDIVNSKIRNSVAVNINEYDVEDPILKEVRTRGLPDDVVGPVRVVTMVGIDSNMCCGTHVKNLADLQVIKILFSEKGKANKSLLHFVAGERVLRYLGECVSREKIINTLLHSNPDDHVKIIEKFKKDLKQCSKSLSDAFKDLAIAEALKFNESSPKPKIFFHHRRDGDMDYLGTLISSINDDNVLKVLTAGEDNGTGILIIQGPRDKINAVSSRVCEILEGKGGGKTRFTAKVSKLSKRLEMEKYILQTLN